MFHIPYMHDEKKRNISLYNVNVKLVSEQPKTIRDPHVYAQNTVQCLLLLRKEKID